MKSSLTKLTLVVLICASCLFSASGQQPQPQADASEQSAPTALREPLQHQ